MQTHRNAPALAFGSASEPCPATNLLISRSLSKRPCGETSSYFRNVPQPGFAAILMRQAGAHSHFQLTIRRADIQLRELAVQRRATDTKAPCNLRHLPTIVADREADDVRFNFRKRTQVIVAGEDVHIAPWLLTWVRRPGFVRQRCVWISFCLRGAIGTILGGLADSFRAISRSQIGFHGSSGKSSVPSGAGGVSLNGTASQGRSWRVMKCGIRAILNQSGQSRSLAQAAEGANLYKRM